MADSRNRFIPLLAIVAILLAAAALRFHLLGAQSLWNDEGSSYVQALRPFAEIAANAGRDIHPPGYYWLLAGWRLVSGTSEFALRSLSVFASLLSIAFAAALGRRLYGWAAGIPAALLIALNTFSIYYGQEARMYALLVLWSAASFWALAGLFQRKTWRWAVALGLLNAAGLWTQYAFPFVMLAQGVVAVVWLVANLTPVSLRSTPPLHDVERGKQPQVARGEVARGLGMYVAANVIAIVLYLPWLPTALHQITTWPNTGDSTPFAEAFNTVLAWLTFGSTASNVPLAIPALLMLFGLLITTRRTLWQVIVPVAWVVIPVGLFLALGLFRLDNVKLLLPAQIGMALWIGRGVWVLWHLRLNYGRQRDFTVRLAQAVPRWTAILSVVWMAAAAWDGIPPLYDDPAYQRADYRGIVQTIESTLRDDDAIILDAPNQEEVFRYYYRGIAPVYTLPEGLGGDDDATRARVEQIIGQHGRAFAVFWGEQERDPQRIVETTLDGGAFELGETWFGDVRLARYVMPVEPQITQTSDARFGDHITLEGYALSAETVTPGDALQIRLGWRTDAPLTTRYKVFLQLLDANGALAAQRDSEPGGGLALTTTWTPGETVSDAHALLLDVPPGEYTLIVGLYDLDDPNARLPVGDGDYLTLATITVSDG